MNVQSLHLLIKLNTGVCGSHKLGCILRILNGMCAAGLLKGLGAPALHAQGHARHSRRRVSAKTRFVKGAWILRCRGHAKCVREKGERKRPSKRETEFGGEANRFLFDRNRKNCITISSVTSQPGASPPKASAMALMREANSTGSRRLNRFTYFRGKRYQGKSDERKLTLEYHRQSKESGAHLQSVRTRRNQPRQ